MNERGENGKLILKTNRGYNPEIHFNQGNSWTTNDLNQIMNDEVHTLTELGELIGRSPVSIAQRRSWAKRQSI